MKLALRSFVSSANLARDGRPSVVLAGSELEDDDPVVLTDRREFVDVDAEPRIRKAREADLKVTPGGPIPPAALDWTGRTVRPAGRFYDPRSGLVYSRSDRFAADDDLVRRFPHRFELAPESVA